MAKSLACLLWTRSPGNERYWTQEVSALFFFCCIHEGMVGVIGFSLRALFTNLSFVRNVTILAESLFIIGRS